MGPGDPARGARAHDGLASPPSRAPRGPRTTPTPPRPTRPTAPTHPTTPAHAAADVAHATSAHSDDTGAGATPADDAAHHAVPDVASDAHRGSSVADPLMTDRGGPHGMSATTTPAQTDQVSAPPPPNSPRAATAAPCWAPRSSLALAVVVADPGRTADRGHQRGRPEAAGSSSRAPANAVRHVAGRLERATPDASTGRCTTPPGPRRDKLYPLTETLTVATPLILAGLGVASRSARLDIGAQGQTDRGHDGRVGGGSRGTCPPGSTCSPVMAAVPGRCPVGRDRGADQGPHGRPRG
ncbi:hypothetical protein QJS66_08605 [Kocuria rhizophila]|nr:hypothetical protein QJS66_08605 [Kocuria rhizophila]